MEGILTFTFTFIHSLIQQILMNTYYVPETDTDPITEHLLNERLNKLYSYF